MPEKRLLRLKTILHTEHAAILAADFQGLNALAQEKETLLAGLPTMGASDQDLADVAQRVRRNQALLMSAMAGVKTAQGSLAEAQSIAKGSNVYERNGKVSRLSGARGDFSHRA